MLYWYVSALKVLIPELKEKPTDNSTVANSGVKSVDAPKNVSSQQEAINSKGHVDISEYEVITYVDVPLPEIKVRRWWNIFGK